MSANPIMDALRGNMEHIRSYGVSRIGLFGSHARGDASPGSDVDVLVEFAEGEKTFDNYMDLKFFLEDLFGTKVDLVLTTAVRKELRSYIFGSVVYAEGS